MRCRASSIRPAQSKSLSRFYSRETKHPKLSKHMLTRSWKDHLGDESLTSWIWLDHLMGLLVSGSARTKPLIIAMLLAGFGPGSPIVRGSHMEPTLPPSQCVRGECPGSNYLAPQRNSPVRECPEGYSMGTVRAGFRYCVPDRTVRE